jgi:hypothetical protein
MDQLVGTLTKPAAAQRSRVGVAHVKSSSTGRTYWAMVIAADYERPNSTKEVKQAAVTKSKLRTKEACRIKILTLCL